MRGSPNAIGLAKELLVPLAGLEPARPCGHLILSQAKAAITVSYFIIISNTRCICVRDCVRILVNQPLSRARFGVDWSERRRMRYYETRPSHRRPWYLSTMRGRGADREAKIESVFGLGGEYDSSAQKSERPRAGARGLSTERAVPVSASTVIRRSHATFHSAGRPHCKVSPWSARSRPSCSISLDTRSPMKISTTLRMISVTTQS